MWLKFVIVVRFQQRETITPKSPKMVDIKSGLEK